MSMPPLGFEPTIAASERPQTLALTAQSLGSALYFSIYSNTNMKTVTIYKMLT
jgi:hypothetical protein